MASQQFRITSGVEGEGPWVLDLGTLMIEEGIELQRLTGFGPHQWVQALTEDDPSAIRFAFYLARKRAGEDVKFADVQVNLFGMDLTLIGDEGDGDAAVAVPDEVAEVVPTGPPTSGEDPILI